MRKIIFIALVLILGMTSCVAQQYRGHNNRGNYPQQRGRQTQTHQHKPHGNNRTNVRVHIGVNIPAVCPYYSREVFQRIVIANRMYNPNWGGNPNLWGYDNPNSPYWPRQIQNKPFKFYYTEYNSICYYTSTNLMMGVSLDGRVLIAVDGYNSVIHIVDVSTGRTISRHELRSGYHHTMEVKTSNGWRLVEIFYNGVCHVNYMDIYGNVLESYKLF